MGMIIDREELVAALKAVKPGIAKQEIIEQSACIIFDAESKRAYTFNDELACFIKLDIGITGAVVASTLSDVIYREEPAPKPQRPDTRMTFVFADATEVTAKFPLAQENNLRVFKDSTGGHAVASADVSDDELMNIAPTVMGTKKRVDEWLASYLQSDE